MPLLSIVSIHSPYLINWVYSLSRSWPEQTFFTSACSSGMYCLELQMHFTSLQSLLVCGFLMYQVPERNLPKKAALDLWWTYAGPQPVFPNTFNAGAKAHGGTWVKSCAKAVVPKTAARTIARVVNCMVIGFWKDSRTDLLIWCIDLMIVKFVMRYWKRHNERDRGTCPL